MRLPPGDTGKAGLCGQRSGSGYLGLRVSNWKRSMKDSKAAGDALLLHLGASFLLYVPVVKIREYRHKTCTFLYVLCRN